MPTRVLRCCIRPPVRRFAQPVTQLNARTMTSTLPAPSLTIGELEANYSLYCKALRLLIREGKSIAKVRRTVCWQRLETLHNCLPTQYRQPDYLYALLAREVNGAA